jgi:anti-repressor protein
MWLFYARVFFLPRNDCYLNVEDLTMSNLQLVEMRDNQAVTSSLIVAEKFGKKHKDVLKAIQNLECSDSFNQRNFAPVEYTDKKGEKRPSYFITEQGFTFLVMGFTGKEAAEFKELFIDAFYSMRQQLETRPALTGKEMALMYLKAEEEKEALMLQSSALQKTVDTLAPKASQYDDFLNDKGLIKMGDFAKASHLERDGKRLGRNHLFNLLRGAKVLFKNGTQPMQSYIDRGLFDVKQFKRPSTTALEGYKYETTTYLTPKGQSWLYNMLIGLGYSSQNQTTLALLSTTTHEKKVI